MLMLGKRNIYIGNFRSRLKPKKTLCAILYDNLWPFCVHSE